MLQSIPVGRDLDMEMTVNIARRDIECDIALQGVAWLFQMR